MDKINNFLGKLLGFMIVPDTRVKRFTEDEAIEFLKKHGKLSYLWDDQIWAFMCEMPESDIFEAYELACYTYECAE